MKYRKKPIVIEAFQYDGDMINSSGEPYVPDWAIKALNNNDMFYKEEELYSEPCGLFIKTLEGNMHVSVGDYIIKGINEELYPCKPDIFESTYELVED